MFFVIEAGSSTNGEGGVEDEISDLKVVEFLPPNARLEHQQVDHGAKGRSYGKQPALLIFVQGAPESLHEPARGPTNGHEQIRIEHAWGNERPKESAGVLERVAQRFRGDVAAGLLGRAGLHLPDLPGLPVFNLRLGRQDDFKAGLPSCRGQYW